MSILLVLSAVAFGYPSTVGHGYTSCTTCHYNPYGYGPLTDYGRALSATTFAARPFFSRASDEALAQNSGFFGDPERLPRWLRLGASFRGMYYVSDLTGSGKNRFIPMQLEGSLVFQPAESQTFVGTFGYAPRPAAAGSTTTRIPTLISREHYWKARFSKTFETLVGFADTAFGTRVPDHEAVHRRYTGLAQNDQTHGVLIHWMPKPWEIGLHAFLGNLFQDVSLRQKGASLIIERAATPSWVWGGSILYSQNDYRVRQMVALHSRSGHGKGSALLAEVGLIRTAPSSGATLAEYVFLQPSLELARGFQLLTTVEHYMPVAFAGGEQFFRITPGLIYAPFQRLEFRVEFQTSRYFGQGVVNPDIFNFLGQVHVWL